MAVVKKPGAEVTKEELLKFYEGKIAKWQIPDDVVFVESIPLGATGKMLKTRLREQLRTTSCRRHEVATSRLAAAARAGGRCARAVTCAPP